MFCCASLISTISFAQTANTLPATGKIGIGTTTPATKLEVVGNTALKGRVKIDSMAIFKDSLRVQKRLIVGQDIKVQGNAVFVGNSKFKNNLKVLGIGKMKGKLVVDGVTKMNGNATVFGNFKIKSLADTSFSSFTNQRLLSILPNGKVRVSTLILPPDDTYTCSTTMPWALGANTSEVILCPNFNKVTIGGNFTTNGLTRLNTTGIGTGPNNNYQLSVTSVNKTAGIQLLNVGASNIYGLQNKVTTNTIIAYAVTNITANQDVFVVKGDGSVGIGTDAPLTKLDVNGQITMRTGAVAGYIPTADASGTMTWTNPALMGMWTLNSNTPADIYFNTGNVGIGTIATSGAKLSVEGIIRARRVLVNNTWADYVFETNYQLMPLADLETYITTKKHLPNVPTSQDVEKDGVDLGEINKILVEKIEELTLYIISINKRIEQLEVEGKLLK